ncbi:hypothetical protein ACWDRR_22660 [Kitasatospora sp. NPDC003701]
MGLTVQTLSFRCEAHARWSVVFDHLGVEWDYDQRAFPLGGRRTHRPAFWLPQQGLWFDTTSPSYPVDETTWRHFAYASLPELPGPGSCITADILEEHPHLPSRLSEPWRGTALLATGSLPTADGRTSWDLADLQILDDAYYRWTLCRDCGQLGAEYAGYANRMPCHYDGHHDVTNSAAPALLAAYRAAADAEVVKAGEYSWDPFTQEHEGGWVRRILVDEDLWQRDRKARGACTAACWSCESAWRESAPEEVHECLDSDEAAACIACPGTVCSQCGTRPAPGPDELCVGCRPLNPPLDEPSARRLLNSLAGSISRRTGLPIASVQYQINEHIGVRRRAEATLWCIGEALDFATEWLTRLGWTPDPPSPRPTQSANPEGPQEPRPDQAAAHRQIASTLPAPRVVITARRTGTCGLCLDDVREGDSIGRIEIPAQGSYGDPGWLCQHCLRLRRHAPRLRDVALRVFHRTWAGKPASLNQLEVRVLADALTARFPVPDNETPDPSAAALLGRLTHALDHGKPANLGTYEATDLIQLLAGRPRDDEDRVVVDAVAAHLHEWRRDYRGFGRHLPLTAQTPLRHSVGPYPV